MKDIYRKMYKGFEVVEKMPKLHQAVMDNDDSLLRRTLSKGCDVNVYWDGEMTLHAACRLGRNEMVTLLLDHGANVHAPLMYRHMMPLSVAIENEHQETAQILIDKGECLEETLGQQCGIDAFLRCAIHCQSETHSYLLSRQTIDINRSVFSKWTPLNASAHYGRPAMAKALLEAGANPNYPDFFLPLHIAICRHHPHIVKLLVAHGADINQFDKKLNCYPIHMAVSGQQLETVGILIGASCDVNLLQTDGKSALYLAAELGHARVAEKLLVAGADPNFRLPSTGDCPLGAAMDLPVQVLYINHHKSIQKTMWPLIKAGADVNQKNYAGKSLLQIAIEKRLYPVARLLLTADCHVGSAEIKIAPSPNEELGDALDKGSTIFTEILRAAMRSPKSLRNQCRQSIKASIYCWPYQNAIASLPVPALIKDFLLLTYLHPLTDETI